MFEKEIEFIYNYNLNKLQQLGSFITYEQLLSTEIHPALLQYVSAEIDFLIFEDREKLLKDSIFDYSGEKIVEYFSNIGEEIKKTKKFSLEYLTKLLLHASSFNVNYIIRPKWSLLQFVFENDSSTHKQVLEVKQILNYLYYYPYLKRLLISFFDKKRIISISLSELEELLNKIDSINYESNFEKVLNNALESISEFINTGSNTRKISLQGVELFLVDKGLSQYKPILAEKYGVNGSNKFEISDFKKTILAYNLEDENYTSVEERDELINQKVEELKSETVENRDKEDATTDTENNQVYESDDLKEDKIVELVAENNASEDVEKKSFLESHLENLEENSDEKIEGPDSSLDETEPIDIDEAPRVDDENIEEVYDLVSEEEELNEIVEEEDSELKRIELEDGNDSDIVLNESEESDDELVQNSNTFVEQGTSITFSSEALSKSLEITEEDDGASVEKENDWPTESSVESNIDELDVDELLEDSEASNIMNEIEEDSEAQSIEDEIEKEVEIKSLEEEENTASEEGQQVLFTDKDFVDNSSDTEIDDAEDVILKEVNEPIVDITQLLENKKIAKIIEIVFDYDMEEFANAIDKISECKNEVEALNVIDEIAKRTFVDSSIKEVKVFKNIISEFFK